MVFVDRSVRVRVPASVGDRLRVQSADGAVYLRASGPIASTRLELQDMASGRLILLDVAAAPAKAGEPALEPMRIVQDEPMGAPKAAFDYTHLGREGADFFAAIVADELARQVPALRRNLIP